MFDRCINGHEFSPANTRYYVHEGSKKRQCITCNNARHRAAYARDPESQRARLRDRYRRIGK